MLPRRGPPGGSPYLPAGYVVTARGLAVAEPGRLRYPEDVVADGLGLDHALLWPDWLSFQSAGGPETWQPPGVISSGGQASSHIGPGGSRRLRACVVVPRVDNAGPGLLV